MSTSTSTIAEKMRDRKGVVAALSAGVQAALRRHAQAGVPAVVWRDGRMTELPAQVSLDEHQRGSQSTRGGAAA